MSLETIAPLSDPLIVLLEQDGADQACEGFLVGEDADAGPRGCAADGHAGHHGASLCSIRK
jgi:hypothetical protein